MIFHPLWKVILTSKCVAIAVLWCCWGTTLSLVVLTSCACVCSVRVVFLWQVL